MSRATGEHTDSVLGGRRRRRQSWILEEEGFLQSLLLFLAVPSSVHILLRRKFPSLDTRRTQLKSFVICLELYGLKLPKNKLFPLVIPLFCLDGPAEPAPLPQVQEDLGLSMKEALT